MKNSSPLTEAEVWAKLNKAVSNSAYNAREEFEKLPEDIRQLVGSPSQLHEWALIGRNEFQTVLQSNFLRSYRAKQQQNRELGKLPADVRKLMSDMENPALEEHKQKQA